ncbi:hypothetical protein KOR34_04090 [Posidoniimonas corsicana]|uniref:DUF378 domain-containing protein n=1 Tax=Posidoniimonas corsicana TaxID=1938618 RepID=A0A5C5VA70_9BACT|nr:hypothetical protein [Posidoniimonas corsicana]TWT35516.1 hypothetical protein KOR34_04090 [Posidoniimonas corsicana]
MQGFGGFLVLMGAGSFVLNMMNREFVLLGWIDNWGPTVGNIIRVGLIALGAAMFALAAVNDSGSDDDDDDLSRDATRHL